MSIRSALLVLGILIGGAVLVAVGVFGTIILLTAPQCSGAGYLCDSTADAGHSTHKRVVTR
jgi:hypothetical protein